MENKKRHLGVNPLELKIIPKRKRFPLIQSKGKYCRSAILLPIYRAGLKIPATVKKIINTVRSAGETTVVEKEKSALRSFNNQASLTALMAIIFGGIIYSVVPSTPFLVALILESSAFCGLIFLNYHGKFAYAKIGMYAIHSCSAIYFGGWLAEALPVDMVTTFLFIYLTCSSCQAYKSWKVRSVFIAATILLSTLVYINRFVQFIPPQHFPPEYLPLFTVLCCGGMLVLIVFVIVQMIRQNDKLTREMEKANRHKTEYLHQTSHELRTPLNAIVGNSQFLFTFQEQLQSLQDGEEILKVLTDVSAAGKIMTDMVNNQLDLAKIEAGKFEEVCITSFSLASVFKTCMELNTTSAKRRDVDIFYDHDDQLGYVQSDELSLLKIVNNLLSNAVKFTKEGSKVWISSYLEEGKMVLVFKNSSSISKEKAERLFTEYSSERNTQFAGTGLGLVITKKLIEQLGGSIVIETLAAHTSFVVKLPYTPAQMLTGTSVMFTQQKNADQKETVPTKEDIPAAALTHKRFSRVKILIAEDDSMSSALLERILLQEGAIVYATESAEEAISVLPKFRPDLIISDNNMPGIGGMGLLKHLLLESIPVPIIIASACPDEDFCKTFIEAGAESYVLKPLDMALLIATLSDILTRHSVIS